MFTYVRAADNTVPHLFVTLQFLASLTQADGPTSSATRARSCVPVRGWARHENEEDGYPASAWTMYCFASPHSLNRARKSDSTLV